MRMSRCFTEFPISGFRRTRNITSIGLFYKKWGFYLEVLGEVVIREKDMVKRKILLINK